MGGELGIVGCLLARECPVLPSLDYGTSISALVLYQYWYRYCKHRESCKTLERHLKITVGILIIISISEWMSVSASVPTDKIHSYRYLAISTSPIFF